MVLPVGLVALKAMNGSRPDGLLTAMMNKADNHIIWPHAGFGVGFLVIHMGAS
jgi:hypothetical protein